MSEASLRAGRGRGVGVLVEVAARLDRGGPVPIYHQLTEALRWQIGMGRFEAGETLPAVRDAAAVLGVNYHTVRRCYAELARRGVVESARRRGTSVRGAAACGYASRADRVVVVECNATQSFQIAGELAAMGIAASSWVLDWRDPPEGSLVTTPFHHAAVRRRWPNRVVHVVPLRPHPDLAAAIAGRVRSLKLGRILLIDRDVVSGRCMKSELRPATRDTGLAVTETTTSDHEALVETERDALVLLAPRVFDGVPWRVQTHARVLEARFSIDRRAVPAGLRARADLESSP